ncbi:hypothetical protein ZWY2020_037194 [Hordeum vulgare]|nr:hypothetical protein ZWY2020_037194 [Hordeum vulgare]
MPHPGEQLELSPHLRDVGLEPPRRKGEGEAGGGEVEHLDCDSEVVVEHLLLPLSSRKRAARTVHVLRPAPNQIGSAAARSAAKKSRPPAGTSCASSTPPPGLAGAAGGGHSLGIIQKGIIQTVNNHPNAGWTAGHNPYLANYTIEQFKHMLGVKPTPPGLLAGVRTKTHPRSEQLPKEFDARSKWSGCSTIGKILDQVSLCTLPYIFSSTSAY